MSGLIDATTYQTNMNALNCSLLILSFLSLCESSSAPSSSSSSSSSSTTTTTTGKFDHVSFGQDAEQDMSNMPEISDGLPSNAELKDMSISEAHQKSLKSLMDIMPRLKEVLERHLNPVPVNDKSDEAIADWDQYSITASDELKCQEGALVVVAPTSINGVLVDAASIDFGFKRRQRKLTDQSVCEIDPEEIAAHMKDRDADDLTMIGEWSQCPSESVANAALSAFICHASTDTIRIFYTLVNKTVGKDAVILRLNVLLPAILSRGDEESMAELLNFFADRFNLFKGTKYLTTEIDASTILLKAMQFNQKNKSTGGLKLLQFTKKMLGNDKMLSNEPSALFEAIFAGDAIDPRFFEFILEKTSNLRQRYAGSEAERGRFVGKMPIDIAVGKQAEALKTKLSKK